MARTFAVLFFGLFFWNEQMHFEKLFRAILIITADTLKHAVSHLESQQPPPQSHTARHLCARLANGLTADGADRSARLNHGLEIFGGAALCE
jgi:hypothetical protein